MKDRELNKQSIQDLVDDHARMGFDDARLRKHLREEHGVLPTQVIPPPTKSAMKGRAHFFATGIVAGPMKTMRLIGENMPARVNPNQSDGVALPPPNLSQEYAQKVADEVARKFGISSITATTNELRERTWRESTSAYFSTIYRPTGQTLLDRIIHGCSGIYRELKFCPGSNYEVYRECITERMERCAELKMPGELTLSSDFAEEWNIIKAIDVSLYPWFKAGCETTNIQIDAEMAEIFLAGKAPTLNSWMNEFIARPIYIDIQEKTYGQRTISGIFCRPVPSHGTFSYMAVVEWVGQGYEAFVFGEYGKKKDAVVMRPGDDEDEDEGLSQEALDAIYDPLVEQIEKLAAMAYMYCRTKMDARQPINPLNSMPRVSGTSTSDKKERNKEKTHSYFRVLRLEIPPDRFGFTGKTGKSWSLDHLVGVTGHFRWQPYGAGNSLNKLIWIDAYEKGKGARHRPESNPILLQVPTIQIQNASVIECVDVEAEDDEERSSCRP